MQLLERTGYKYEEDVVAELKYTTVVHFITFIKYLYCIHIEIEL